MWHEVVAAIPMNGGLCRKHLGVPWSMESTGSHSATLLFPPDPATNIFGSVQEALEYFEEVGMFGQVNLFGH